MKFTSFGRNHSVSARSAAFLLTIAVGLGMTAPSVCAEEVPAQEPPVIEDPVIEEPVIEEPVIEEPVIEDPVIEEPVVEEPVVEEPIVEDPVVEEPVIEEPAPETGSTEPPVEETPEDAPVSTEEPVVTEQPDTSTDSSAVSTSSAVSDSSAVSSSSESGEIEEAQEDTEPEEVEEITDIDPDIDEEEMRRILEEYFAFGSIEKLMESVEIVEAPEIRKDFRFETIRKNPAWAIRNCSVREEKSSDSRMIGALPRNGICYIIEEDDDGWIYVESGDVRGFIQKENLTKQEPTSDEPEMTEQEPVTNDSELTGQELTEDDSTNGTKTSSEAGLTGNVRAAGTESQNGAIHPGFTEAAESVFSGEPAEILSSSETEKDSISEEADEAYQQMHTPGPLVIRNIREEQKAQEELEKNIVTGLRTLGVKEKTENTPPESPNAGLSEAGSQEIQISYSIEAVSLPDPVSQEMQISYSIEAAENPESSIQEAQNFYSTDTAEAAETETSEGSEEPVSESVDSVQDAEEDQTDELFEDGYPLAVEYVPYLDNSAYAYVKKTTRETVVSKKGAAALSEIGIQEETFDSARAIGVLPENGLCYILEDVGDEWSFVESGDVRGFVRRDELELLDEEMNSKTDEELYSEGYLTAEENVKPSDNYALYYTLTSVREPSQESYTRQAMMDYASQFVGRPYVWGGNDLMNGVDCSGFVREVYKAFGYDLPRIAAVQAYEGIQIPVDEAEPGDLIFYANSNGYIYHVVMSTGNGGTIEAMSASMGIVYSTVSGDAVWAARIIEDA